MSDCHNFDLLFVAHLFTSISPPLVSLCGDSVHFALEGGRGGGSVHVAADQAWVGSGFCQPPASSPGVSGHTSVQVLRRQPPDIPGAVLSRYERGVSTRPRFTTAGKNVSLGSSQQCRSYISFYCRALLEKLCSLDRPLLGRCAHATPWLGGVADESNRRTLLCWGSYLGSRINSMLGSWSNQRRQKPRYLPVLPYRAARFMFSRQSGVIGEKVVQLSGYILAGLPPLLFAVAVAGVGPRSSACAAVLLPVCRTRRRDGHSSCRGHGAAQRLPGRDEASRSGETRSPHPLVL